MTLRRQLLLIALWTLTVALAMWDGYRYGMKQGPAASPQPRTTIEIENLQPLPEIPAPPPERTNADWRLN